MYLDLCIRFNIGLSDLEYFRLTTTHASCAMYGALTTMATAMKTIKATERKDALLSWVTLLLEQKPMEERSN